jgi:hypothetical protein
VKFCCVVKVADVDRWRIAGETVIELTQEEKGIIERYDSDKKMYS